MLQYQQKNISKMQRAVVFICAVLVSILLLNSSHAAIKKHVPAKMQTDTSKVDAKKFSAEAILRFRQDKNFDYRETAYSLSAWERFWAWVRYALEWIWGELTGWLTGVPYSGVVIQYLLLGASLGLLVYFILKSRGIDLVRLWRGESTRVDIPYTESLENIHEIDFDAEIEKAISHHNYRLAIRLLYLRCLKQLSDKQLIQWQIDKTNGAYLHELSEPGQKQYFARLTRQFEYIWYGDFPIDSQAFGSIHRLFQDFKQQLP